MFETLDSNDRLNLTATGEKLSAAYVRRRLGVIRTRIWGTQMAADLEAINARMNSINEITRIVIGAGMKVSNELGVGFAEKVYENALMLHIRRAGLSVRQQASIRIDYENEILGVYVADLLVEDMVIVEVKALPALQSAHRYQCINYLKATGLPVCLLMNFGRKRMEFKRFANTCGPRTPATVRAPT